MSSKNINKKLKKLVDETGKVDMQLKNLLLGLENLEDVIKHSENISDRVSHAFTLYDQFIEILKK